jgi:DNA-directed RNA polymerase subunit F
MVNNLLRAYKTGYYLVPSTGFVMEQPNEALEKQLSYDGEGMPEDVYEQLKSASQSFYRFDADKESKKKAIASLADILENVRGEVKDLLNSEYGVPKNEHDKLIFDIVNNYNIRHDNQRQKTSYSKDIWYEWMMQYYTSVIIAFYKLKSEVKLIF